MSSILKVDQIQLANGNTPTAGDLGLNITGNVLQVQQVKSTGQLNTNTAAWHNANSGLWLNITPSSTSSKILVSYCIWGILYQTNGHLAWDLQRTVNGVDSGRLSGQSYGLGTLYTHNISEHQTMCEAEFLDSPNTTSQVTYKPMANPINGGTNMYFGGGSRLSVVTAIEIAG